MNNLSQILARLKTRPALITLAIALVLLNGVRFGVSKYGEVLDGIESKQALLGQYRISTKNIESLRTRINRLEQQKKQFDVHMFSGPSRKDITSAMQIKVQEILGRAGLNPESLRPTGAGGKDEEKQYGEVVIKIRLTGELKSLITFLSELYKQNYFFKIENFTLKPYKKKELKVFLELKGFYKLEKAKAT